VLLRAVIACLLLCTCAAPAPPDAGTDAGRDAGADAGRDAGRDAGWPRRDAGPDAGRDAGPLRPDPGWVALPDLPGDCAGQVELAMHPEVLFAPVWGECDPPSAGCRQELFEAGPWRVYPIASIGWSDGDGEGYFSLVMPSERRGGRIEAIGRTDGAVVAAWREPVFSASLPYVCVVGPIGIGDDHGSMVLQYLNESERTRSAQLVYAAPLSDIGAVELPVSVIPGAIAGYNSPQREVGLSRSLIALQMELGSFVLSITPDGAQRVVSGALGGSPQRVVVVGDQIFWEDWNDAVRIARSGPEGPAEILWDASPGEVRNLEVGEDGLAWIQGYDRPPGEEFQRLEVWTAPLPAPGEPLAPRFVRTIANRGRTAVGGGYYVITVGAEPLRVEIIELATGRTHTFVNPPSFGVYGDPIYSTERDVLLIGSHGLFRLDPTAMPYDD
jgi:hypothetical protein